MSAYVPRDGSSSDRVSFPHFLAASGDPPSAPARPAGTHHLLGLAEVDVLLVPAARPGVPDVREADEGHGAAAQQQNGEEHDADGGGADELPLLHGLQVQVQAQGVGDGPPQAWATVKGVRGTEAGGRGSSSRGIWAQPGTTAARHPNAPAGECELSL